MVEKILPSEFWFITINYAVQLSNYLPIKTNTGNLTTPFFEAYSIKPDYRKLLPLLSIAYVKKYKKIQIRARQHPGLTKDQNHPCR